MKLSLGFSPCPNDTFIFDALVNKKIDSEELEFDVYLEDVQTLNEWALNGKLDITKISYGVLPLVSKDYSVLNAGGALGKGVGPLLIAEPEGRGTKSEAGTQSQSPMENPKVGSNKYESPFEEIENSFIAIPGRNTTAHLLFSLAFPSAKKKIFLPFNQIENFVLGSITLPIPGIGENEALLYPLEEFDSTKEGGRRLGVIIHESRFTYQQKGLVKLMDLGEYWEQRTGYPIPLGGVVMRRNLPEYLHEKVNALIRKSVETALTEYPSISDYVKQHAQEMNEEVMRQHINLYVNDYSLNLGNDGKHAVETLQNIYYSIHNNKKTVTSSSNLFSL